MKSLVACLTLSVLFLMSMLMEAQQVPEFTLTARLNSGVYAAKFDAAQFPSFSSAIDSATARTMKSAGIIVVNKTQQSVVAIAVEWTIVDSNGTPHRKRIVSDSYLLPVVRPVLEKGDVLLVSPLSMVTQSSLNAPRMGMSVDPVRAEMINTATSITGEIDAVILEDGTVDGPDRKNLALELKARKAAATDLALRLRTARKQGEDPKAVLARAAANEKPVADAEGQWRIRFARQYLSTDPDLAADELGRMPELPEFKKLIIGGQQ